MITIGCDVHLKTSTMTVLGHDGVMIKRKRMMNNAKELLAFIDRFDGPKQLSMEATYNWPVFYDLFKDQVDQYHLIHPKRFKAITASQAKCDKNDADTLAHLTHLGYFPKAYTAEAPTRQFRRLLRTRVHLSRSIAAIKNRIHALLNANTFWSERPKNFKDLFCKRGLEYLKTLKLPESESFLMEQLLEHIQAIQGLRDKLDGYIEQINFQSNQLQYLRTVPGMNGKLFKYIVLAEIDNIHRFKNARTLIAYAGLIPKEKSSESKIRKGRLRTDANPYLRWAMIEATLAGILKDPGLKAYYKQMKQAHHTSAARIAVARRMLRSIYYVLKEQRPYFLETEKNRR